MEKDTIIQSLIKLLQDEYIVELNESSTNLIYQAFKQKRFNLAIFKYLHTRDCSIDFKKIVTPDVDLYNELKLKSKEELDSMTAEIENAPCPHCGAIVWEATKQDYFCDNCNKEILVQTKIQLTITPAIELDLYDLSNKIDITIENRDKIPQPVIPLPHTEVTEDSLIIDFIIDVYVRDSKSKCNLEDFNLNCQDINMNWVKFQIVEN